MTERILEALLAAAVNKLMGEEERNINLSLTWPGLQHPSASGSYGQRCGHSHKLTQVLFQLSQLHIFKFLLYIFFFSPYVCTYVSYLQTR